MSDSQFRYKGQMIGKIAIEFVEKNASPPEHLRPDNLQQHVLWGLEEALGESF